MAPPVIVNGISSPSRGVVRGWTAPTTAASSRASIRSATVLTASVAGVPTASSASSAAPRGPPSSSVQQPDLTTKVVPGTGMAALLAGPAQAAAAQAAAACSAAGSAAQHAAPPPVPALPLGSLPGEAPSRRSSAAGSAAQPAALPLGSLRGESPSRRSTAAGSAAQPAALPRGSLPGVRRRSTTEEEFVAPGGAATAPTVDPPTRLMRRGSHCGSLSPRKTKQGGLRHSPKHELEHEDPSWSTSTRTRAEALAELEHELGIVRASVLQERQRSKEIQEDYEARLATQMEKHSRDIALLESMNEKLMAENVRLTNLAAQTAPPAPVPDLLSGTPQTSPRASPRSSVAASSTASTTTTRRPPQAVDQQKGHAAPSGAKACYPVSETATPAASVGDAHDDKAPAPSQLPRGDTPTGGAVGALRTAGGQPRLPGSIPVLGVLGGGAATPSGRLVDRLSESAPACALPGLSGPQPRIRSHCPNAADSGIAQAATPAADTNARVEALAFLVNRGFDVPAACGGAPDVGLDAPGAREGLDASEQGDSDSAVVLDCGGMSRLDEVSATTSTTAPPAGRSCGWTAQEEKEDWLNADKESTSAESTEAVAGDVTHPLGSSVSDMIPH